MVSTLAAYVAATFLFNSALAAPVQHESLLDRLATMASSYGPVVAACPATPLVRAADGLSSNETTYRTERKKVADVALKSWLTKTNSAFTTGANMPTVSTEDII